MLYPHGEVQQLDDLLRRQTGYRRRLIVSDSLFSMDGDAAPLAELAELSQRHGAMLMLDEAHATGVFGSRGTGLAEERGVQDRVHVHIGTLSKALGCAGGFVCGSRELIDWLVNRARPYIFSTAAPPATSAAALAALDIVESEPWRRQNLLAMAAELRSSLVGARLGHRREQQSDHPTDRRRARPALAIAATLRDNGLFVPAIRPPSVPVGRALLRISLSSGHTPEMIARLLHALDACRW